MTIQPDLRHPAWCDPRVCTTDEFATDHRQMPTTLKTSEPVEVAVQLYLLDEPTEEILPGDLIVVMTVRDTTAAATGTTVTYLSPAEARMLAAALLVHAQQGEAQLRGVVAR